MKDRLIIFGDSIIRFNKNKILIDWSQDLKKKVEKYFPKKYIFLKKTKTGLNSNQALTLFNKFIQRIKYKKAIAIIQIGINDSWHYKSLKGKPNINIKKFESNLSRIIIKLKKLKVEDIFIVNYHQLLNNRLEVNKKTINQNLRKYIYSIKKICKKKKVRHIDILNQTKKINSKRICRPMPDGVHLNKFGSFIYSEIIFKKIKSYL